MAGPRDLLEAERQRTLRRLTDLSRDFAGVVAASRDSNADDEHDPEGSTIAFERSHLETLVRNAWDRLEDVDAAIDRLEGGTYGLCERCGLPIGEARLEARPLARRCIDCADSP